MGIAIKLHKYLERHGIDYDVVTHKRTNCSSTTADASHIPSECLAKGVVLKQDKGYLLAVLPACNQVEIATLGHWLNQPVELASEAELDSIFEDCDTGAVPPIGAAYGLGTIYDEALDARDDIYLEGGDHRTLIHLSKEQFHSLMENVPHQRFSAERTTSQGPIWAN